MRYITLLITVFFSSRNDTRLNRTRRWCWHIGIGICASMVAAACHTTEFGRDSVTVGTLTISNAYMVTPVGDGPAVMYFTVQNSGAKEDTLTDVRVAGVAHAELHMEAISNMPHPMQHSMPQSMPSMTMTTMVPTPEVPVPAGRVLRLAPRGRHVMLMGTQRHFRYGDSTDAELIFRHAGAIHIAVRVIDYAHINTPVL